MLRRTVARWADLDGDFEVGCALVEAIRARHWLNRRGAVRADRPQTFSAAMTNAVDLRLKIEAILVGEPAAPPLITGRRHAA